MLEQLATGAVAGSWPAAIALCVIAVAVAFAIVRVVYIFFHAFD